MLKRKNEINLLELTPTTNYQHEINEEGLVDVLVPRFKSKFMQKFIPKGRSLYIRANLDEIGSKVWCLIDGKTKVFEIAESLKNDLGEKAEPIYPRLNLFLTQLYHNGFIYFLELKKEITNV